MDAQSRCFLHFNWIWASWPYGCWQLKPFPLHIDFGWRKKKIINIRQMLIKLNQMCHVWSDLQCFGKRKPRENSCLRLDLLLSSSSSLCDWLYHRVSPILLFCSAFRTIFGTLSDQNPNASVVSKWRLRNCRVLTAAV